MDPTAALRPLMALALAFVAVIWVSPFAWLVTTAIDPKTTGVLEIPRAIGIDNFVPALSGTAGLQFLNSVWLSVGTATLTVIDLRRRRLSACRVSTCRARTCCSGASCCCACCPPPASSCRSISAR